MRRLAVFALLLACGGEEDRCREDDTLAYLVPITLSLSHTDAMFAKVETCYLPISGPMLCASGALFDAGLSFGDTTRRGLMVTTSAFTEPTLAVTWHWTHATWLEDGDRYSIKVTKNEQVLLERTESVTYGDFDTSQEPADEDTCTTPVVAELAF